MLDKIREVPAVVVLVLRVGEGYDGRVFDHEEGVLLYIYIV